MRSISPIIATILLIVMTIGIIGLMYAWLTGLLTNLQGAASQQAQKATQVISFDIADAYFPNSGSCNTVTAVIYNAATSTAPMDLSQAVYTLKAINTVNGQTVAVYSGSLSSTPSLLNPSNQEQVNINFNGCSYSSSYEYVLTVSYQGTTESATVSS